MTTDNEMMEVLDGQQRLSAIVEFLENEIPIDGNIEPYDESIQKLHGLRFNQLPERVRFRIEQYSIRIHELYDYQEGEPYELFFRLNQGVTLTPAEKRNTFFGPVREQIKNFVACMNELKIDGSRIGFNNNRLAYDDVMARFVYAIHTQIINKKITDVHLVDF
ncbi:GmrSD restriction endonuclease domain-containing protein [Aeromonas sobria]|uniref:GmrSD restriction endonuclease domain-containing protein n=1 Tax=Aeromonas sobria TaxID=646 RepID=UPI0030B8560B